MEHSDPPEIDSQIEPGFFSLRIRPFGFLAAFGTFVGAASLGGFLSKHHWAFDLFSHFRFQYAVSLSLLTVVMWVLRFRRFAALFGVVAFMNLATLIPLYVPPPIIPHRPKEDVKTVLHVNVDRARGDKVAVGELIETVDADVLSLCEISTWWLEGLERVLEKYPYRITHPREDNFGIGLFSKHPFKKSSVSSVGQAEVPTCLAVIEFPETDLFVIGTHPLPPGGWRRTYLRNQQLEALGALVREATQSAILMGDLNVTPWSYHFKELLGTSGLLDSGRGWGFQPTWSANNPLLWIPIDHFLHSGEIRVVHREIGPDVGSDHYPLIVHFTLGQKE